jgi:hypothetical protein
VSGREEVRTFRDLMVTVRDWLLALIDVGKTADEAVTGNPLAELYKGRRSYFQERLTHPLRLPGFDEGGRSSRCCNRVLPRIPSVCAAS